MHNVTVMSTVHLFAEITNYAHYTVHTSRQQMLSKKKIPAFLFTHIANLLIKGLTPRTGVLLQKLTVPELVEKFPAFYRTRRFITAFTRARHLSLS
jgi:hypothetical protein